MVRTVVVAVAGTTGCAWLVRAAGRYAVVDRSRARRARPVALPRPARAWLERALTDAAVDLPAAQALQILAFAVVGGAVVGSAAGATGSVVAAAGVVIAGAGALRLARHRRPRLLAAAMPSVLDVIAADLRAGGTVATGVGAVAASDSPAAPGLARVEARVRLGATLPDALAAWSREHTHAGGASVAGALALAASVGGRGADALDGLASSLRQRLAVAAEARALSAQARYSAVVIGAGPVLYLAFSALVDPRSVRALVATPVGRACALSGLALDAFGAWWMGRILRAVDR